MKNATWLRIIVIFSCLGLSIPWPVEHFHASADSKNAQPVVVELFTSEGCSSCPPADALLLKLEISQTVPGANVIAIEEHVDYWNHDGWTDPYSSADWTQRQIDYVTRFKDKEPYTPQLIVDGQVEMTGGMQQKTEQAIQQAAAQPKTAITLTPSGSVPDGAQINVRVGKLAGNSDRDTAEVWLAITESGLASTVDAGENAGKNLHHASVLRSLHKIGVASTKNDSAYESSQKVKFKPSWNRQNLLVAVFIQEKKSMHILGAAAVPVSTISN
jgi:hypothetical protein